MITNSGEPRHDHEVSSFQLDSKRLPFFLWVAQQENAAESITVWKYWILLINLAVIQVTNHVIFRFVVVNDHSFTMIFNFSAWYLLKDFHRSLS